MTEKGIDLIGSMHPDTSWQAKAAATIEDETGVNTQYVLFFTLLERMVKHK